MHYRTLPRFSARRTHLLYGKLKPYITPVFYKLMNLKEKIIPKGQAAKEGRQLPKQNGSNSGMPADECQIQGR